MTFKVDTATAPTNAASSKAEQKTDVSSGLQATPEQFLQILVAQLQNQDPTDPLDAKEMVTSLGQLNQLSYSESMSNSLSSLVSLLEGSGDPDLTSLMSKSVSYATYYTPADGDMEGEIYGYDDTVTARVVDETGEVLHEINVGSDGKFTIPGGEGLNGKKIEVLRNGDLTDDPVLFRSNVEGVDLINEEILLKNGEKIVYGNVIKIGEKL